MFSWRAKTKELIEGKDGQTRRRLKRITIAVLENLLALQLFQSLFLLFVTRGGLSMAVK